MSRGSIGAKGYSYFGWLVAKRWDTPKGAWVYDTYNPDRPGYGTKTFTWVTEAERFIEATEAEAVARERRRAWRSR